MHIDKRHLTPCFSDPALIGYSKGVPMGGELQSISGEKALTFLVASLKDPISGNLDRIQIIKGWLDKKGETHEQRNDKLASPDQINPEPNLKPSPYSIPQTHSS